MNSTHIVRHFSFGPKLEGITNPLDGGEVIIDQDQMAQIKYTIQIVPTTFDHLGSKEASYQYSVTEYRRHSDLSQGLFVRPGIFFKYSFSPLRLEVVESRAPFLTFITSLCAILGGVFTCCGMFDSCTEKTAEEIKKLA